MDLRRGWEALKARLRGWYSAVFGNGTSEDVAGTEEKDVQTSPREEPVQKTPPEITEDVPAEDSAETAAQDPATPDGLVAAVCERLEHLRRKRMFAIRKKPGRMEWLASHADFTDAYLFLLSIPGADISRLGHRRAADSITYRMELSFGVAAELTDDTRQEDTIAVLRLMTNGRCMLKINFINDIKKLKRRNDYGQSYFDNDKKGTGRADGTSDSLRRHAGDLRGEVPRHGG